jgi:hypothetical protein
MGYNFKHLFLVASAILSLASVGASAQAAQFHSEGENAALKGAQVSTGVHVFKTTAGEVTCSSGSFTGTQPAKTASSIRLTPTYSGCHRIIFGVTVSATVNFTGCEYVLYSAGSMDLYCSVGHEVEMNASGCSSKTPGQSGRKSVSYTNNGTHIDITFNVTGFSYSHEGFACSDGLGTNGTLTGRITMEGSKGKVWYE